ncbi:MAG: heavy-metal-associated domain-containing protein [Coriobacteriales bacterium]|nr:heavy-metal-associated domain-containing protein [Coriobacteriales bacterium]
MKIVHIKTDGMHCDECPLRIETEIEHLRGVKAARTYRSMHLTSVLYDADLVDANTIRDRVANAGFEAHVVAGSHGH